MSALVLAAFVLVVGGAAVAPIRDDHWLAFMAGVAAVSALALAGVAVWRFAL